MMRPRDQATSGKRGAAPVGPSAEAARGRPGRRTAGDRRTAVLELLAGKATVDQLARRFGVLPSTIEGWRADALAGIAEALRRGTGTSARELELEREDRDLREALTDTTVMARAWCSGRWGSMGPALHGPLWERR